LAAVLALGLSACGHVQGLAHLARPAPWVKSTPVVSEPLPEDPAAGRDRLYRQAVAAIEQRDYGLALDLLQLARSSGPDDARVLNGLGVVYDKLQRFDLSARYYELAEKADPGSRIVEANRRYSMALQAHAHGQPDEQVRLAAAPTPALSSASPIRRAIHFLNATGAPNGAAAVRASLSRAGWTVSRLAAVEAPVRTTSKLLFPPGSTRLASSLARTLPFPVELEPCHDCTGLDVVVGADALGRVQRGSS